MLDSIYEIFISILSLILLVAHVFMLINISVIAKAAKIYLKESRKKNTSLTDIERKAKAYDEAQIMKNN